MKKKILSALVSSALIMTALPGVPVLADPGEPEETQHTVIFVTDGHYEVAGATQFSGEGNNDYYVMVDDGDTVDEPTSPAIEVFSSKDPRLGFWAWSYLPGEALYDYNQLQSNIYDFDTAVTDDVTLYALSSGNFDLWCYDLNKDEKSSECGTFSYNVIVNNGVENLPDGAYGASPVTLLDTKVVLTATPADGYSFVGWSTSDSTDDIVSTHNEYKFTYTEHVEYYALFEKVHDVELTIYFGTAEEDYKDSLKITVPSNTTIEEIEGREDFTNKLQSHKTTTDGAITYFTLTKPISEYKTTMDLPVSDYYLHSDTVNKDCEIYVSVLIPVNSIELTITPPTIGDPIDTPLEMEFTKDSHSVFRGINFGYGDLSDEEFLDTDYDVWFEIDPAAGYFYSDKVTKDTFTINGAKELNNFEAKETYATVYATVTAATKTVEEPVISDIKCVEGANMAIAPATVSAVEFRFKSETDDSETFDLFDGIIVDKAPVPEISPDTGAVNWTARRGSVIITLSADFLKTLSEGTHTLTVVFKNGTVSSTTFTIVASAATSVPSTGESMSSSTVLGMSLISAALLGAGALIVCKKKKGEEV